MAKGWISMGNNAAEHKPPTYADERRYDRMMRKLNKMSKADMLRYNTEEGNKLLKEHANLVKAYQEKKLKSKRLIEEARAYSTQKRIVGGGE